jgi:hypothetical protein
MERTLEYQLRAAEQRLAGIMVWLRESWTFAGVRDKYDAEQDIARLKRSLRTEHASHQQQRELPFEPETA